MPGKVELKWEDPPDPPPSRLYRDIVTVLEQLKSKPNQWAQIARWDAESAAYATKRKLEEDPRPPWMPAGHYEFKTVREELEEKTTGGKPKYSSKLYARYLSRAAE